MVHHAQKKVRQKNKYMRSSDSTSAKPLRTRPDSIKLARSAHRPAASFAAHAECPFA
jgi:hypothetical protein